MAKRRKKSGSPRRRKVGAHRRRRRNPSVATAYPTGGGARTGGTHRPRRHKAKRKGRARARRYTSGSHKGRRIRTYKVRNRHGKSLFHVRGWRAHRANGKDGLMAAAIAVGAGVVTSIAASFLLDTLSTSVTSLQSSTYQEGVLLVTAGLAAWFIPSPIVAAGVATGLLLIPLAKLVYSAAPSLASTYSYNPENPSVTMQSLHRPIGSLHRPLGSLHRAIGSLHGIGASDEGFFDGSMSGMRGGLRASR
jgi:hypothetical protein